MVIDAGSGGEGGEERHDVPIFALFLLVCVAILPATGVAVMCSGHSSNPNRVLPLAMRSNFKSCLSCARFVGVVFWLVL